MSKTTTPSRQQANATRKTTITCVAPDAAEVFVAGTFNDWKPDKLPLKRDKAGRWSVDLELAPGRYEFKFIVDGQWCCDAGCSGEHTCPKCVPNEFGSMNRVLEVG